MIARMYYVRRDAQTCRVLVPLRAHTIDNALLLARRLYGNSIYVSTSNAPYTGSPAPRYL